MDYFMLNKPAGCVTAKRDERWPTVMDCFPASMRERLHPVGRLDMDTTGLLLVTDDGGLDNYIMQPAHHIEKCYRFHALGELSDAQLARLESGITLMGGAHEACPATVVVERRMEVRDCEALFPEKFRAQWMKNPLGAVTLARITITEGRRHQVKLMLRAAGCRVFQLERLRLGGLTLDASLAPGKWRALSRDEVNAILPGYLDESGLPTRSRNWKAANYQKKEKPHELH